MYTTTTTMQHNYWLMPIKRKRAIIADDVINAACKVFELTEIELLSKSRIQGIVQARYICFKIMHGDLRLTLAAIGRIFNLNHTTIIHGLRAIENDLSVAAYRQEINEKIRAVKMLL